MINEYVGSYIKHFDEQMGKEKLDKRVNDITDGKETCYVIFPLERGAFGLPKNNIHFGLELKNRMDPETMAELRGTIAKDYKISVLKLNDMSEYIQDIMEYGIGCTVHSALVGLMKSLRNGGCKCILFNQTFKNPDELDMNDKGAKLYDAIISDVFKDFDHLWNHMGAYATYLPARIIPQLGKSKELVLDHITTKKDIFKHIIHGVNNVNLSKKEVIIKGRKFRLENNGTRLIKGNGKSVPFIQKGYHDMIKLIGMRIFIDNSYNALNPYYRSCLGPMSSSKEVALIHCNLEHGQMVLPLLGRASKVWKLILYKVYGPTCNHILLGIHASAFRKGKLIDGNVKPIYVELTPFGYDKPIIFDTVKRKRLSDWVIKVCKGKTKSYSGFKFANILKGCSVKDLKSKIGNRLIEISDVKEVLLENVFKRFDGIIDVPVIFVPPKDAVVHPKYDRFKSVRGIYTMDFSSTMKLM